MTFLVRKFLILFTGRYVFIHNRFLVGIFLISGQNLGIHNRFLVDVLFYVILMTGWYFCGFHQIEF